MGGVTRTLAYQYDAAGNRTRITHPDGQWFITDYDALDRPIFLHGSGGGVAQSYYTPAGALADLNRVGSTFTHIGYDAVQRPTWRGHFFTGADNVPFSYSAAWSYAFNPAGQIGAVSRDNDDFAWRRHYGVNRAYATNGLNQYTAASSASFAYDPNGNLIADGTNTYGYDVENRMVAGPNGATLSYDPLGRLFQVTGAGNTTRFLYDGDALVAEYDGPNAMIRRHVHWVGADVALATYEGSGFGALRQLFADYQGSIVALADTGGHVVAINTYDEYGFPGTANSGRFQYTGQIWIPELGMYHYKARIYSPALGRFMQTDPIGYQDQFNLYAYVGNDPVNGTDPTGEFRIVYHGTRTEQRALSAAVQQAARSDSELSRRHQVLQESRNVHDVHPTGGILPRPESRPMGHNAAENSRNGVGTGSRAVISLEPWPLRGQGLAGKDITASPGAQVAHEILSHSYEMDQGINTGQDVKINDMPVSEFRALEMENKYRAVNGEEGRLRHSPEVPW